MEEVTTFVPVSLAEVTRILNIISQAHKQVTQYNQNTFLIPITQWPDVRAWCKENSIDVDLASKSGLTKTSAGFQEINIGNSDHAMLFKLTWI